MSRWRTATWNDSANVSTASFDVTVYDTVDPGLAGRLRVRVVGGCPSGGDIAAEVAVLVAPFLPGDTNAVFSLEKPGGLIDSAGALAADLGGIGKDVIVLDDILDFACRDQMGPGTVAWVMLGTWPENHVLTVEESTDRVQRWACPLSRSSARRGTSAPAANARIAGCACSRPERRTNITSLPACVSCQNQALRVSGFEPGCAAAASR